jgi:hypothetical protein
MLKRGLVVAVALWLYAASAHALSFAMDALPGGPVVSGNGQLEFSHFQFFSPFMTVDPSEVTANILADGIQLSGPISTSNGLKNFFVLYEVHALGAGIDRASLLLDSQVDADGLGLVLSTKQILGDVIDEPHGGWDRDKKGGNDFDFGLDLDHSFPTDRRTLAFLKTADWEIGVDCNCFHAPLGLGCNGAIRLVEAGFDPQESIRVIDGVTLVAHDGTATWESSTNRFSLVPEPGTASLMLLGLASLALLPHRRH